MYRGTRLPDRAFHDLLAIVMRRLTTLERRIRWPGAVRFTEDASTNVPRSPENSPSFVTLMSLTLDPGVWVLEAATTMETSSAGAPRSAYLRIPGSTVRGSVDGGTVAYHPLSTFARLTLTAQTTVLAEGAVTCPIAATSSAIDAYMIAIPA